MYYSRNRRRLSGWFRRVHSSDSESAPIVSAATLSGTDKNAASTISGSGLIATGTAAGGGNFAGRGTTATTAIGAGVKRLWQVTVTNATGVGVGVANATNTYGDGTYLGNTASAMCWFPDGSVYIGGANVGTLPTYAVSNVLHVFCDGGNKFWGAVGSDPDTGTGGINISALGTVYPAYNLNQNGILTFAFALATVGSFSAFP